MIYNSSSRVCCLCFYRYIQQPHIYVFRYIQQPHIQIYLQLYKQKDHKSHSLYSEVNSTQGRLCIVTSKTVLIFYIFLKYILVDICLYRCCALGNPFIEFIDLFQAKRLYFRQYGYTSAVEFAHILSDEIVCAQHHQLIYIRTTLRLFIDDHKDREKSPLCERFSEQAAHTLISSKKQKRK